MTASSHELPAWAALDRHLTSRQFSLRDQLQNEDRTRSLGLSAAGLRFDFAKHLVTEETIDLLVRLAHEAKVEALRDAMFAGEKINSSEDRSVLHTALRLPAGSSLKLDGADIVPEIQFVLNAMGEFSDRVRTGAYKGYTGKAITDVVCIGIGGSDLGPRFVTDALINDLGPLKLHFVSNVDGHAISDVLRQINPETTMFIVASKTFTTEETLLNATTARDWLVRKTENAAVVGTHFIALSTNRSAVEQFGIRTMFSFWDWVGGRYSLWSSIGLPIILAIGKEKFRNLLAGAHAMDVHFRTAPLAQNVPVMMALLGILYRNFYDYPAHLIMPYDERLAKMAKYIQQMDMESNGKSVRRDRSVATYQTAPFIFGEPGTDSQHSFMQLVHQGTTPAPVDFIACITPGHDLRDHHAMLLANCLAQSRALAVGLTLEEAGGDPFRVFSGNRPSTTILLPSLTPATLGALIAAYEHKVFVQGTIWGLNSFDQPGVELGKKLAKSIRARMDGTFQDPLDASTETLLKLIGR